LLPPNPKELDITWFNDCFIHFVKAIDSIDYKNDTLAVFASSEGDLDITDKICKYFLLCQGVCLH
jgi:hypothetical protein